MSMGEKTAERCDPLSQSATVCVSCGRYVWLPGRSAYQNSAICRTVFWNTAEADDSLRAKMKECLYLKERHEMLIAFFSLIDVSYPFLPAVLKNESSF